MLATQVLVEIQQFLGVHPTQGETSMVKIHTGRLADTLKNFDQVANDLKGTPLEWMLWEDNT